MKYNKKFLIFLILCIVILLLFILNIIDENKIKKYESFDNMNKKYVCMYAYYEKDRDYRSNLEYFLKNGILDNVDYYFILNGKCSVNIPEKSNIKVLKRENKGFDFGAWSYALSKIDDEYDYYIFVNSSVKGPFKIGRAHV